MHSCQSTFWPSPIVSSSRYWPSEQDLRYGQPKWVSPRGYEALHPWEAQSRTAAPFELRGGRWSGWTIWLGCLLEARPTGRRPREDRAHIHTCPKKEAESFISLDSKFWVAAPYVSWSGLLGQPEGSSVRDGRRHPPSWLVRECLTDFSL